MRGSEASRPRVLIVDDNIDIHAVIRDALADADHSHDELAELAADLLGDVRRLSTTSSVSFDIDSADSGPQALELVEQGRNAGCRYAVAFMDVRMPPGWNGIETSEKILAVDPSIQIVICTAYSDFRWDEIIERLGQGAGIHLLRKPFTPSQVRQIAEVLSTKWRRISAPLPLSASRR